MARAEDSNCSELNKFMNGLCVECLIAFLTVLDIVFITTEILIREEVIAEPLVRSPNSTLTILPDDDSSLCRKCVFGSPIDVAYCASHYASVSIAGLFLVEVFLRLVAGCPGCWKDTLQVFDGFVVLTLCVMEILFTLFWTKVICHHVAIEASTYIVIFRLCRLQRACSVRKRRYAARLENEMHYLRRAKTKAEDHARDLTGKLKKQQKELYELNQKVSPPVSVTYILGDRSQSSGTLSDDSVLNTGNGHVPNGVIHKYAENKSAQIVEEAKKEAETAAPSRQNSIQYKSLLSEIETRPRGDILQKSTRSKSNSSLPNSPAKASTLQHSPQKEASPKKALNGNSPTQSINMSLKQEIETKALTILREKSLKKSSNSVNDIEKERTMSGTSNTSSTNEADVVKQLENIVRDNQIPSPYNSVSGPSPGSTVNSRMSSQSVETDDDQAVLIRRGKNFVHGHVNSAFCKEGDNTEPVHSWKNLEVMAEYEGTRTYRSAEGIPLTDL